MWCMIMMTGALREHIIKRLTRSGKWPTVRKAHLLKFPKCSCCGKRGTQVHHIKPFHLFPELELDPANLLTFCSKHHFSIGHAGWWVIYNPYVLGLTESYKEALDAY